MSEAPTSTSARNENSPDRAPQPIVRISKQMPLLGACGCGSGCGCGCQSGGSCQCAGCSG
ncbi:hypothetical protein [Actinacidiphila oryziradicis]|uniref:Metallothionein n=1 Tax=Actinacidiphila oryziradicis TaxID=2571141 RepID=A0A4U0SJK1_9ACTN|nr:hypothetical protein [Actinacidiphila oryziradicis]TKA08367.1 hypothetical protein FCI23_28125 [Actinacidiphila oryziradicis]